MIGVSRHSLMAVCTKILTLQNIQTAFEALPVSYSMVTRDILPGGKGVEV
jgi:hypothetical protein